MENHCPGESGLAHDMQVHAFGHCDGCGGTEPNPPIAVPAEFRNPVPTVAAATEPTASTPEWDSLHVSADGNTVIAMSTPDPDTELVAMHWLKGTWR